MSLRPLALALALVLLPNAAQADDLLQTYRHARDSDPQFSAAESTPGHAGGAVQARAAMLPQISGNASLRRSQSEGPSTFQSDPTQPRVTGDIESTTTSRNLGIDGTQMLYDRSRFTTLKGQQALSRASDFQLASAGNSLITRTSAAYFNVLVQLETLAAAEAAEAALKKQFDFASKRLEVGLAPITDMHEARAQFDGARANTILARNAVQDAYQALVEITGQPVASLKGLPDDFQAALPEARDVDGWVQTAIASNPALQAKQAQVEATAANVETARAAHWPTLYLSGGYGSQATWGERTFSSGAFNSTSPINSEGRGPSVGLTLNVPIFNGFATQSRVRQALAQRDVAQDELEQQRRSLERNTRSAYQALVAGISEVEARKLALVSAQSAYEASQVGLEVGTRTVLDVLNNQRSCFRPAGLALTSTTSCRTGCCWNRPPAPWTLPTWNRSIACSPPWNPSSSPPGRPEPRRPSAHRRSPAGQRRFDQHDGSLQRAAARFQQAARAACHPCAGLLISQQDVEFGCQRRCVLDHAHRPGLAQAPGDVGEIVQVRSGEDRGAGGGRLQQVVPAHRLQAAADERHLRAGVEVAQFPQAVDDEDPGAWIRPPLSAAGRRRQTRIAGPLHDRAKPLRVPRRPHQQCARPLAQQRAMGIDHALPVLVVWPRSRTARISAWDRTPPTISALSTGASRIRWR